MFGFLAAVVLRAVVPMPTVVRVSETHCQEAMGEEACSTEVSSHSEDCPQEHHHHQCPCSQSMAPIVFESQSPVKLGLLESRRTMLLLWGIPLPEGPSFDLDKPPLI